MLITELIARLAIPQPGVQYDLDAQRKLLSDALDDFADEIRRPPSDTGADMITKALTTHEERLKALEESARATVKRSPKKAKKVSK